MKNPILTITVILFAAFSAVSQTTEFTYQGTLKDGANAANGNYDLEFRLFDASTGGSQHPTIVTRTNVAVTNGTFAVTLDFFSPVVGAFPGADRYLEIRVKNAGGLSFTLLTPRQKLGSTPYAQKSINAETSNNATALGGVGANQFVQTGDPRLSDPRPPIGGSTNYIQNRTSEQSASNFNISGTGTANIFNALSQFNIGNLRVLGATPDSVFGGFFSGTSITTGTANTFFGAYSGRDNTEGLFNSFFGRSSGWENTTGIGNSFFGHSSGSHNTTGGENSFFGRLAGDGNTTGTGNTFVGRSSGNINTTGSNNTALGFGSDVGQPNLTYATAIGSGSTVAVSNTIALGRSNGADRVFVWGLLDLNMLGSSGSQSICRNVSGQIATCSSSLRYKTNIAKFGYGLDLISRLRPITFDWKDGGMHDLGLGAEDVAAIEPLLVTYNKEGQVEGVKYDRIGVVLINAVKEQQAQIETQQKEIEILKALLCRKNKKASVCKTTR